MYTTLTCSSCIRAKRLLKQKGVEAVEIDVSFDRQPMIERSGRFTVPQIYIGNVHVGGFDELVAFERRGVLDRLLAGEQPVRSSDDAEAAS